MTTFGVAFLFAPALWVRLFTPEAEVLAWIVRALLMGWRLSHLDWARIRL